MSSRRATLKILAASPAVASVLQAQHVHSAEPANEPPADSKPRFLRPAEMEKLSRLCDLIIPRTDTPGAADAGVPLKIDRAAAERPKLGRVLRSGLKGVSGEPLAYLTRVSQEQNTRGREFFDLLKSMTIDLYYTSKEGLVTELGWHGNTFLSEFKGCTHPEHQG